MKTKSFLRMEGNHICRVEERIVEEAKAEDWLEAMRLQTPVSTGIIPRDCIFHFRGIPDRDGNIFRVYVLEKEPRCVNIKFRHGGRGSGGAVSEHRIHVPFTLFFFQTKNDTITGISVACSKKKIIQETDPLFELPMPNIYIESGKICTGGGGGMKAPNGVPTHVKMNSLVKDFFMSEFNRDLQFRLPETIHSSDADGRPTFDTWETKTKENPLLCVSDQVTFRAHAYPTLLTMLQSMGYSS